MLLTPQKNKTPWIPLMMLHQNLPWLYDHKMGLYRFDTRHGPCEIPVGTNIMFRGAMLCRSSFQWLCKFLGALDKEVEANTFEKVVNDARWIDAMKQKIPSLHVNNTIHTRILSVTNGSTWWSIIRMAPLSDTKLGSLLRDIQKGRSRFYWYILTGCQDDNCTNNLCIVAIECLPLYQMNVNNAFLQRELMNMCTWIYLMVLMMK